MTDLTENISIHLEELNLPSSKKKILDHKAKASYSKTKRR